MNLIVLQAFGAYSKGDRIADEKAIAEILASENAAHVTPVPAPAEPPKAASKTAASKSEQSQEV